MARYLLKLYISGRTPRSELTIRYLHCLCAKELQGQYELEIIDVLECPELAEAAKILATPTLSKETPPPLRRIIGDLSDRTRVLLGLGLLPSVES